MSHDSTHADEDEQVDHRELRRRNAWRPVPHVLVAVHC